ncbi:hypothetical protein NQ318_017800 [Aromia moschata]|uniref:Major facilitator superfamily (MFS) profile domain-containing protein n=1 Tax=Aromia moschata TaxID=1265417 RepID=A0AAV8X392_9CUCU|nr:hypothetical protein NQ318_017800 [Aromia moschata]
MVSFVTATTTTWTSPVLPKLEDPEQTPFPQALTSEEASWISSLLPLGAVFGPFVFGYLADKIGRKHALMSCAIPYIVSCLMLAFSKTAVLYYIARFITGSAVGGVYTVISMYVGEIATDSNRGALGSTLNCFVTGGQLFSYVVGPYVSIVLFNIILAVFPVLFLTIFFILGTESPHYYVRKQQHDLARTALHKLRGYQDDIVDKELLDIQTKIKEDGHGTFLDIFKSRGLTRAFIISVGLLGFQQFTGITAVLFYAQSIFKEAGASLEPEICSIIIGVVQFVASFVTPLVVERSGRRFLLLLSAAGMMISEAILGIYGYLKDHDHDVSSISFLPILCIILYIITYNIGYGPIPWTIIGELFPSNVKSAATSASTAVGCFLSFLTAKYFKNISDTVGMGPCFWIFSACCVMSVPFCLLYVIETKGKNFQEIQKILNS